MFSEAQLTMSNAHTDFAGHQLELGDIVAASSLGDTHLRAYKIVAFTENGFHGEAYDALDSSTPHQRNKTRRLLQPHQISKMGAK